MDPHSNPQKDPEQRFQDVIYIRFTIHQLYLYLYIFVFIYLSLYIYLSNLIYSNLIYSTLI